MEECVRGAEGGSASRERFQSSHIALHNASGILRTAAKKPVIRCEIDHINEVTANSSGKPGRTRI